MFHLYTPWKHQKTFGFLTFSGGVGMEYWAKTSLELTSSEKIAAFFATYDVFTNYKKTNEIRMK